jgi:hypothetical protein
MKTMKYFAVMLVLTLGTQVLFAENDGPVQKETPPDVSLEMRDLVPDIPRIAGYDEEVTFIPDFSPVIPREAPLSEAL